MSESICLVASSVPCTLPNSWLAAPVKALWKSAPIFERALTSDSSSDVIRARISPVTDSCFCDSNRTIADFNPSSVSFICCMVGRNSLCIFSATPDDIPSASAGTTSR